MGNRIVLASASPRRRELLAQLEVEFSVAPADVDESVAPGETAEEYVRRMAVTKARAGQLAAHGGALVIGADTAVVLESVILGKPADETDALRMLEMLSGQTHRVLSAVAVTDGNRTEERMSATEVSFRPLTTDESAAYWATGEPCDKAGAYAIQGLGALFVTGIHGSYTGVVGLPLYETAELLAAFGRPVGPNL